MSQLIEFACTATTTNKSPKDVHSVKCQQRENVKTKVKRHLKKLSANRKKHEIQIATVAVAVDVAVAVAGAGAVAGAT